MLLEIKFCYNAIIESRVLQIFSTTSPSPTYSYRDIWSAFRKFCCHYYKIFFCRQNIPLAIWRTSYKEYFILDFSCFYIYRNNRVSMDLLQQQNMLCNVCKVCWRIFKHIYYTYSSKDFEYIVISNPNFYIY